MRCHPKGAGSFSIWPESDDLIVVPNVAGEGDAGVRLDLSERPSLALLCRWLDWLHVRSCPAVVDTDVATIGPAVSSEAQLERRHAELLL